MGTSEDRKLKEEQRKAKIKQNKEKLNKIFLKYMNAFIAGDIGIEYSFDFPLLLSLDFRPELGFGNFNDDLNFGIALGLRYQF
jgi:hypothetical protein